MKIIVTILGKSLVIFRVFLQMFSYATDVRHLAVSKLDEDIGNLNVIAFQILSKHL